MARAVYVAQPSVLTVDRRELEAKRVQPPAECGSLAELFCWQRQLPADRLENVVALKGEALELLMRAAGPVKLITPFGNLILDYGAAD